MKSIINKLGAILFLVLIVGFTSLVVFSKAQDQNYHAAKYFDQLENKTVRCNLCPNQCVLKPDQIGICKARKNIEGKLVSLVYGLIASKHIDPIEKKPLYHFLPGSKAYSIATTGCNLACKFCQNWQISQIFPWEIKSIRLPKRI